MDNTYFNQLNQMQTLGFAETIKAMIGKTCIVDFGIIKKVSNGGGVVTVETSVVNNNRNIRVVTCPLLNLTSQAFSVYVKPKVDDKVLLLSFRRYDKDMFDYSKNEPIINKNSQGYSLISCVAILCNQFRPKDYKNSISFDEGNLKLKLAYDKDNDKNLIDLETKANGDISFNSNDNLSFTVNTDSETNKSTLTLSFNGASVTIDGDGYIAISDKKVNDKQNKIVTSSSGITLEDKNGCKIVTSSSDVQINGKLKINK